MCNIRVLDAHSITKWTQKWFKKQEVMFSYRWYPFCLSVYLSVSRIDHEFVGVGDDDDDDEIAYFTVRWKTR